MAIMAYRATAEIVSAYDDEVLGRRAGIIEIRRCPACGKTTVTAVFDGYAAQAADTTERLDEIHALAVEAVHRALIEEAPGGGCQIGMVYLEEEIPDAYQGITLDYLDKGAEVA